MSAKLDDDGHLTFAGMSDEKEMNGREDLLPEDGEGSEEMYERLSLTVDQGQEPLRIDRFLTTRLRNVTRNKIQQAVAAGMVLVNAKPVKSNYKIKPGDQVVLYSDNSPEEFEVKPEPLPLDIAYEDDDIMIIDKKAGMVVHPGHGNTSGTLVNGIAWHLQQQGPSKDGEPPRNGLVHRIDRNTSGLLVMAKNDRAAVHLANQFFEHTVYRRYLALVWGDFEEEEGTVRGHVGRHLRFRKIMDVYPEGDHGKEAVTHYRVMERFRYVTLIECRLETGRTHQIRVHMQHIGHPLFNDDAYGGDRIVKGTVFAKYRQFVDNCFETCARHALHAQSLGFIHPVTGMEMRFESRLPEDMERLLEKWRRYVKARPDVEE
jgi:23S rRNA pseudouridine1911/1915/1917 synthase